MSRSNGYPYPEKPPHLPILDPLTERLISPRIPYMQIRRLRHEGSYGILGQVIIVPVDVDSMVQSLPRALDDDYAFNVNLKKHIVQKSSYLSGYVEKFIVEAWLRYLVEQPLYKYYKITVDWATSDSLQTFRPLKLDSLHGPENLTRFEPARSRILHPPPPLLPLSDPPTIQPSGYTTVHKNKTYLSYLFVDSSFLRYFYSLHHMFLPLYHDSPSVL